MSIRLCAINVKTSKLQNGKTAKRRAQILCADFTCLHTAQGRVIDDIIKKFASNKIRFLKIFKIKEKMFTIEIEDEREAP